MTEPWLMDSKKRNMPNMHEQDGMIKLWAQMADEKKPNNLTW